MAEEGLGHVGFSLRLNCEELESVLTAPLYLSFELTEGYPETAPLMSLRAKPLSAGAAGASLQNVLKRGVATAVMRAAAACAEENAGEAMVYEVVTAARECIAETAGGDEPELEPEPEPEPAL